MQRNAVHQQFNRHYLTRSVCRPAADATREVVTVKLLVNRVPLHPVWQMPVAATKSSTAQASSHSRTAEKAVRSKYQIRTTPLRDFGRNGQPYQCILPC